MPFNPSHNLFQTHTKLKNEKDEFLRPLVEILPKKFTPNRITLFRLLLTLIWLAVVIWKPSLYLILIFFVIYFFDLLDGAVARLKNQVTYLGEYFDAFSDRVNHVTLFVLLTFLLKQQLFSLNFFIGWDVAVAIFIVVEYFLKSPRASQTRTLLQFCVRFSLWLVLAYEIVRYF